MLNESKLTKKFYFTYFFSVLFHQYNDMFSLQPLYPVTINRLIRLTRLNLQPPFSLQALYPVISRLIWLNLRLQPLHGPAMLNSLWAWWQQRLIRLNLQLQPPFSLQPLYPVINRQIRLNLRLQSPFSLQPLYPVTINRLIRLNLQLPFSPQPLYPVINRLIRLNLRLQPLYSVINRLIRLNLQPQPPYSPAMLNSHWVLWQQDLRGLDSLDQDLLQGLGYLDQDRLDRVPRVQDSQDLGLLDPGSNPHPEPIL